MSIYITKEQGPGGGSTSCWTTVWHFWGGGVSKQIQLCTYQNGQKVLEKSVTNFKNCQKIVYFLQINMKTNSRSEQMPENKKMLLHLSALINRWWVFIYLTSISIAINT